LRHLASNCQHNFFGTPRQSTAKARGEKPTSVGESLRWSLMDCLTENKETPPKFNGNVSRRNLALPGINVAGH